jgi:hypothetical protein
MSFVLFLIINWEDGWCAAAGRQMDLKSKRERVDG